MKVIKAKTAGFCLDVYKRQTEQMLPIIEKMDQVGYHAVECWGGATFDASLRFLKEDPWERLRKFRDGFKNTKLQMLFRGQNILGYRPYADDVVEYFVQKSAANGIDIIRIFDCLNDIRNLKTAVTAANKEKAHAQVAKMCIRDRSKTGREICTASYSACEEEWVCYLWGQSLVERECAG